MLWLKSTPLLFVPVLVLLVWVAPALGHAHYERSDPADGATLAQSPAKVDVYFTQEVRRSGGLPTLVIVNDTGDQVQTSVTLDDADRKHMSAQLAPSLPAGRYTVIWHTLSDDDGEEAEGAFHFFVGAQTSGTPTTQTPSSSASPSASVSTPRPTPTVIPSAGSDDDNGVSTGVIAGLVAGGLVVGMGIGGGATWLSGRRR